LLASLLGIVGGINGYSIILNLTQSFSINTGMRKRLSDIIVKDIKGTSPLRPRLLKPKVSNKSLLKIEKFILIQLPLLIRIQEL
jgi:hypothetical protein